MKNIMIALALVLAFPLAASATQPQQKLPICHRTASDSNPYVIISPDSASWYAHLDNHVNHTPKNGRADKFAIEWSDGSYRCTEEPPVTPPNPPVTPPTRTLAPGPIIIPGELRVRGYVCGDPRVRVRINNTGPTKLGYQLIFRSAKTGKYKAVTKNAKPNTNRWLHPRWVKGGSRFTVISSDSAVLWQTRVNRANNIGACPK